MNTAIIVAAGAGKRFGQKTPKQFLTLRGKTLLEITLSKFEQCSDIGEIVLVVPEDSVEGAAQLITDFSKLGSVVAGGETRSLSVLRGLEAVRNRNFVAVHDGARPLVSVEEISRTVRSAAETGAACLVMPVTDTIKRIEGDQIAGTLDRTKLRRAVTPQCFRYELLERAFRESSSLESATDECTIVEALGVKIKVVEGSARNIKITVPEDLNIARALLDEPV